MRIISTDSTLKYSIAMLKKKRKANFCKFLLNYLIFWVQNSLFLTFKKKYFF